MGLISSEECHAPLQPGTPAVSRRIHPLSQPGGSRAFLVPRLSERPICLADPSPPPTRCQGRAWPHAQGRWGPRPWPRSVYKCSRDSQCHGLTRCCQGGPGPLRTEAKSQRDRELAGEPSSGRASRCGAQFSPDTTGAPGDAGGSALPTPGARTNCQSNAFFAILPQRGQTQ